jgi:hypothetical protein
MSSCQNGILFEFTTYFDLCTYIFNHIDSGIIKYSVDSDQKKKSASTKRPDPKSSVQKVTTSSTPKEAASESEENQEPLVQKSDPPVQTIATEDELSHQQNVPNEAKSSTKPLTDKEKISKEATETKSRAKNVATCENQVDASKIEAPVTEVTDEETCPEPKTPSTPNENPISSPGSPNVGTESHEKEAAPMDVDQASSSKTESPSSAELEFTTMLTKVNLKVSI